MWMCMLDYGVRGFWREGGLRRSWGSRWRNVVGMWGIAGGTARQEVNGGAASAGSVKERCSLDWRSGGRESRGVDGGQEEWSCETVATRRLCRWGLGQFWVPMSFRRERVGSVLKNMFRLGGIKTSADMVSTLQQVLALTSAYPTFPGGPPPVPGPGLSPNTAPPFRPPFPPTNGVGAGAPPFPPNGAMPMNGMSMPPFPPPGGGMPPPGMNGMGMPPFRPLPIGAGAGAGMPPFPPAPGQQAPQQQQNLSGPPPTFTPQQGAPPGGNPGIHPDRLRMMGV